MAIGGCTSCSSARAWTARRNLVYRLYCEEGLALRSKQPRRRKMVVQRQARCQPTRPNEAWSLDFVHDALSTGQTFRALTVMDVFTRCRIASRKMLPSAFVASPKMLPVKAHAA